MRKCALHNLGCKVNSYETQAMQQMMEEAGYKIVPFGEEKADIYIINTCSVTNIADRKSRQMIHKARKMNEDAVIVATGCYVESAQENVDDDIDIVIGNNEKSRLVDILNSYFSNTLPDRQNDDLTENGRFVQLNADTFDEMDINGPSEHTRAYVKIQDGCNRFCTYCIIPYVRGKIRSRDAEAVCEEIKRIAQTGCQEVVLTGIHLSSYGIDKPEVGIMLIDIIEKINKIDGIKRIRLGSLEPGIVTEEFVKRLTLCEKICPHFHLSLQSGCNETLKRMNRRYTVDEFYNGVCLLRKYFNNPAITTDVIVGFPGETEEEFTTTRKYLEKVKFYELHVFKYSRRKGTLADKMPMQLSDKQKSERSDILLKLDEELTSEYRRSYIGKTVNILLEEVIMHEGSKYFTGFTDTYVKVMVPYSDKLEHNTIIKVNIIELCGKDVVIGVAES